jgi:hypothetical protein
MKYTVIPESYNDKYDSYFDLDKLAKKYGHTKVGYRMEYSREHPVVFAYFMLGIKLRKYQAYSVDMILENKDTMWCWSRQKGKEQPYSAKVLTPTGFVTMGSLKYGDKVISKKGKETTVVDIFEQGEKDVYKLTFDDDTTAECGLEHLWEFQSRKQRYTTKNWQVGNLKKILGYYKKTSNIIWEMDKSHYVAIPLTKPVEFEKKDLKISPYIIGALLGDGTITGRTLRFTSEDKDIVDEINYLLPKDYSLKKATGKYEYSLTGKIGIYRNIIKQELKRLNLHGKNSHTKFIPYDYLHSSINDRINLLKGLMDTDGYIDNEGYIEYTTVSKQLKDDFIYLVQSLGMKAEYTHRQVNGFWSYRIRLKSKNINPFYLKRKADRFKEDYGKCDVRFIRKIELVRKENSRCIMVDDETHTYLTNNFIVTHNSVTLGLFSFWAMFFNKYPSGFDKSTRIIYISHTEDGAKKIIEEINKFIELGNHRYETITQGKVVGYFTKFQKGINNVFQVSFKKQGTTSFLKSFPPTSRIVGNTGSILIIDECARLKLAISEDKFFKEYAEPTISAYPFAKRIYSSTPEGMCYDDKTEVLTQDGFKLFKDVNNDELIWSRNPDTGKAELCSIESSVDEKYEGEMYNFKSRNLDLCVTPAHWMIGYNQKSNKRERIQAYHLSQKKTDFWIDRDLDINFNTLRRVVIPSITYIRGRGTITTEEIEPEPLRFYKWLGFWLADGHVSNNLVAITQKDKSKLEEYEKITNYIFPKVNTKIIPHGESWRLQFTCKQIADYIRDFKFKGIPIDLIYNHKMALEHIWEGFYEGDGDKTSKTHCRVFVDARHKGLTDSLQFIALVIGKGSHVNYGKEGTGVCIVTKSDKGNCKIKTYTNQMSKSQYDGNVYCLKVKHGELYVRRNGRTAWCGNTGYFYYHFDPFELSEEHTFERIWFPYTIHEDEAYQLMMEEKRRDYERDGKFKEFQQEYLAMFVASIGNYFDHEKHLSKIFKSDLCQVPEYKNECNLGLDFGGQRTSKTVLTITAPFKIINDKGKNVTKLRRLWHKVYPLKGDNDLIPDIKLLKRKFPRLRATVDSLGGGYILPEIRKILPCEEMVFRRDKATKFDYFRVKAFRGEIESYKDEYLEKEMYAMTSEMKAPSGYTDDAIDAFIMSCYPYLKDVKRFKPYYTWDNGKKRERNGNKTLL